MNDNDKPTHDWTGRRVTLPTGPPTLAERDAPLLARIAELERERDAYRAFAVKIGEIFAPPDADDMIERHMAPGDLADLAEYVDQQLAAGRDERAALRAQIAGALVIEVARSAHGRFVATAPAHPGRTARGDNREDAVAALMAILPCVEIREVE